MELIGKPTENHSLNEMIIAENGPLLHRANSIRENAMNRYWMESTKSNKWHFLRQTDDVRTYMGDSSKVIGKLFKKNSKLPFM